MLFFSLVSFNSDIHGGLFDDVAWKLSYSTCEVLHKSCKHFWLLLKPSHTNNSTNFKTFYSNNYASCPLYRLWEAVTLCHAWILGGYSGRLQLHFRTELRHRNIYWKILGGVFVTEWINPKARISDNEDWLTVYSDFIKSCHHAVAECRLARSTNTHTYSLKEKCKDTLLQIPAPALSPRKT